jgi:hypothetical protein
MFCFILRKNRKKNQRTKKNLKIHTLGNILINNKIKWHDNLKQNDQRFPKIGFNKKKVRKFVIQKE